MWFFWGTGWGGWGGGGGWACYAATCLLSLARRSWCYAATCLLSLARRSWCYAATCLLSLARCSWCYAATCLLSLARRSWCYAATCLFCFYVQVSPWAENVFRSVMSKWNLRVKRVNADTRRMARSALTRNGQPWNGISQKNCVLRRPMDCWMKKLPSMCAVLSGDPIHLESTSSKT